MKFVIFGANGAIGQLAVKYALSIGDEVIAYTRRDNALTMNHENLEIVVGSLTDDAKLSEVIQLADVVISALGPALSMSRKVNELPIARAHEHIIKVMKKLQKNRLITLGTPSIKATQDRPQIITKLPSMLAKVLYPTGFQEMKKIEQLILQSDLDWTVVRIINPNVKDNDEAYETSFGDTKGSMNVSRENVAYCLIDSAREDRFIHKMPIVFNK